MGLLITFIIVIAFVFMLVVFSWIIEAELKAAKNRPERAYWRSIMRNPKNYEGKTLQISGKISQVMGRDDEGATHIKIDVDEPYYVVIPKEKKIHGGNPLEGDYISFIGICAGTTTITTILGVDVELPLFLYVDNY